MALPPPASADVNSISHHDYRCVATRHRCRCSTRAAPPQGRQGKLQKYAQLFAISGGTKDPQLVGSIVYEMRMRRRIDASVHSFMQRFPEVNPYHGGGLSLRRNRAQLCTASVGLCVALSRASSCVWHLSQSVAVIWTQHTLPHCVGHATARLLTHLAFDLQRLPRSLWHPCALGSARPRPLSRSSRAEDCSCAHMACNPHHTFILSFSNSGNKRHMHVKAGTQSSTNRHALTLSTPCHYSRHAITRPWHGTNTPCWPEIPWTNQIRTSNHTPPPP